MQKRPQLKIVGGIVDKKEMFGLIKELKKLGHSELEIIQLLGIKKRTKNKT